jgi:hypothetical protein
MWQPRLFGILTGWLALAAVAIYFLQTDMVQAGLFGESCKTYGMSSWACGVLPNLAVWTSSTFVYFLEYPFTYNAANDWIGASSALMWTGSPIAYTLALVATNYWVWKLNEL